MKRLFAALLTAALLLAGCAPAGEGLSSAPAETVTGFRWGGEEDTLHQFADHDGSINGYRDYTITACFSADGEASPPVPLTMEQIGSQFFYRSAGARTAAAAGRAELYRPLHGGGGGGRR